MHHKPNFAHILSYKGGGAVQEALPIEFTPIDTSSATNPYTDLSGVLGTKDKKAATEINLDDVNKANGLMGEKRALLEQITSLKTNIDQKVLTDKYWIKSDEGIRSMNRLQTLLSTAPSDLKRSEEIALEGFKRTAENTAHDEWVTDLNTGKVLVKDYKNNGQITAVTAFELFKDQKSENPVFRPVTHNEARLDIESGKDAPYENKVGLYLKNMIGQIKGSEARQKEIDSQLDKVGYDKTAISKAAYNLVGDNKDNLMKYGMDPTRLVKTFASKDDESNYKQLEMTVNRLIDSDQGLSREAKNGLRNAAIERVVAMSKNPESGVSLDDPRLFETAVRNQMKALLVEILPERAKESHSEKTDVDLTSETATRSWISKPIQYQLGNLQGMSATPVEEHIYKSKGRMIPTNETQLAQYFDRSAILIGDGKMKVGENDADDILSNMFARTAYVSLVPMAYNGNGKLEVSINSYKGTNEKDKEFNMREYTRTQNEFLEKINKEKQSGRLEEAEKLGQQMKTALREYLVPTAEMRTAMVYNGYYATETSWRKTDNGNRVENNGGRNVTKEVAAWNQIGLSPKSGELFETQVVVPLVKEVSYDKMLLGTTSLRVPVEEKKEGGKIKIMNIGGKLMSFNDLKSL